MHRPLNTRSTNLLALLWLAPSVLLGTAGPALAEKAPDELRKDVEDQPGEQLEKAIKKLIAEQKEAAKALKAISFMERLRKEGLLRALLGEVPGARVNELDVCMKNAVILDGALNALEDLNGDPGQRPPAPCPEPGDPVTEFLRRAGPSWDYVSHEHWIDARNRRRSAERIRKLQGGDLWVVEWLEAFERCDIDQDETVDMEDAIRLLQFVLDPDSSLRPRHPEHDIWGDIDGDRRVDLEDVLRLLQILLPSARPLQVRPERKIRIEPPVRESRGQVIGVRDLRTLFRGPHPIDLLIVPVLGPLPAPNATPESSANADRNGLRINGAPQPGNHVLVELQDDWQADPRRPDIPFHDPNPAPAPHLGIKVKDRKPDAWVDNGEVRRRDDPRPPPPVAAPPTPRFQAPKNRVISKESLRNLFR